MNSKEDNSIVDYTDSSSELEDLTSLDEEIECPVCGAKSFSDMEICFSCGNSFKRNSSEVKMTPLALKSTERLGNVSEPNHLPYEMWEPIENESVSIAWSENEMSTRVPAPHNLYEPATITHNSYEPAPSHNNFYDSNDPIETWEDISDASIRDYILAPEIDKDNSPYDEWRKSIGIGKHFEPPLQPQPALYQHKPTHNLPQPALYQHKSTSRQPQPMPAPSTSSHSTPALSSNSTVSQTYGPTDISSPENTIQSLPVTESKQQCNKFTIRVFWRGAEFTVKIPKRGLTIGRARDNDIVLNNKGISRHHVKIEIINNEIIVEDQTAMNPAYIDGKPLRGCLKWRPLTEMNICDAMFLLMKTAVHNADTT